MILLGYTKMVEENKIKCQSCGCEISKEDSYALNGITICDDCYIEKNHKVVTCNPLATYSAKKFEQTDGKKAEERLNEKQRLIFNYIKSKGKVTPKELVDHFKMSKSDLENQLAILRHLELTKGRKEKDQIYIVEF